MARQPYFSGNYGSALAQVDTRPIMEGARAQAAMYQNLGQSLGQNIGGAIEKYQLNKVKRAKLTGDIEAYLEENPDYANKSTMTGDEAVDKKNMTENEKFLSGDLNMARLEGLAGKLARGDTLRKNKRLEESQNMQNEMQKLAYGIQKKLEDTNVNMGINAGIVSDLLTKRKVAQDPKEREAYDARISEILKDLGMGASRRALETKQQGFAGKQIDAGESLLSSKTAADMARLGDVPGQVKSAKAARKRADETAKAYMDIIGGPEGAAEMSLEEKNLTMNNIQSSINYRDSLGKASVLNSLAKANAPVSIKKQAGELSAFQGHLLGYKVRDPIGKGQISFEKYLELSNSGGEGKYPLTGDNAGTAGRIYATFLDSQKKIDDLVKTVEVQAVVPGADGDQSVSAPTPGSTVRGGAGLQANNLATQQANFRRPEDEEYERILNVWNVTPPARRGMQPTPPPNYQP